MKFKHLLMIFILLFTLVGLPSMAAAQAEEGTPDTAEESAPAPAIETESETVSSIKEYMELAAYGLMLFILACLAIAIGITALAYGMRWQKRFTEIDKRLVGFGNTSIGKAVHEQAVALHGMVDQPTDRLVLRALDIIHEAIPKTSDAVTADYLSAIFSTVTGGLVELTNGAPVNPEDLKARLEANKLYEKAATALKEDIRANG